MGIPNEGMFLIQYRKLCEWVKIKVERKIIKKVHNDTIDIIIFVIKLSWSSTIVTVSVGSGGKRH